MATGATANTKWGLETTFGVEASNVDNAFGYAVEISNLEVDNQQSPRRGLGSRNFQAMGFGAFKGTCNIKFDMNDPFVWRLLTGGYQKSGSTGAYTYTFAEALTLPSFTVYDYIKNIDGGANTLRKLLGCVVLDYSLDVATGAEPISLTLNVAFANIEEDDTEETLVVPDTAVLMYAHASLAKAGVTISKIESFSLKCNQNAEMKEYLGSRNAQRCKFGDREYDSSVLHYYGVTSAFLQDFYGVTPNTGPINTGPTPRNYVITVAPYAGTTAATYTFTFTEGYIVRHGMPQKVNDDIMEDISILFKELSVAAAGPQDSPTGW